jgi:hypothetical protein
MDMISPRAVEETTFSFSRHAPPPPERRQQPRHLTILRVGAIVIDGKRELCLIRNISIGGLMAHVYSSLAEGQRVTIELKANQIIPGYVLWISDSNVGIEFDQEIDLEEMLANQSSLENGWLPRMPRVEVDRLAELRVGARVYPVNTCDISQGGVKIQIDHPLETGSEIVLTMEKFRPIQGVVRWYQDGEGGIAFNNVIPFHELMQWLRAV